MFSERRRVKTVAIPDSLQISPVAGRIETPPSVHEFMGYINDYHFGLVLVQVFSIRKERVTFQKYGVDEVFVLPENSEYCDAFWGNQDI